MKNILVTPTFAPDFKRCKELLGSCDRWVSGVDEHYLIIDSKDAALFKPLQTSSVRVICKEELLPIDLWQIPFQNRWWFTSGSLPVRGWILQQVIKLAFAQQSKADAVVFADSDLVFIKPFNLNSLWRSNQLRLWRQPRGPKQYRCQRYQNWYNFAAKVLEVEDAASLKGGFISQLMSMRPDVVRKLCQVLERRFQRPWYQVLLNTWDFSEYTLYGLFVESLEKQEAPHFFVRESLCHSSWHYKIASEQDVTGFIANAKAQHCAVHLQSNLRFDSVSLNKAVQRMLPTANHCA